MNNLQFSVAPEVLALGVNIVTAYMTDITNKDTDEHFEQYKGTALQHVQQSFLDKTYKDDPILLGFRELHTKVGKSNRDYIASPEALLSRLIKQGIFPHINLLVDIYNLHSVKTSLGFGAHDRAYIKGNVSHKFTTGIERFIPLGKTESIPVPKGEYGYIDDENNVICRLEVLQVEPTKVTTNTKDVFLIIEGNSNTDIAYVKNSAQSLLDMIQTYCGGTLQWINSNGKQA